MKKLVDWKSKSEDPEKYCDLCHDTGYYGDNGPGRNGNKEYVLCECDSTARDRRQHKRRNQ